MLRVNEINDFNEFENLKGIWNKILQKSRDNDVFSTWEWLRCLWEHFGKERKLKMLIAQEKNEIIGVAPLMLSKYSFLHLGKLHKIEFIGSPHSDYNNFILLRRERECLKLFLNYFIEFSDWDMLELSEIREGSVSANVLREICNTRTSKLKLGISTLCPYIKLPASAKVFANHLSRNMRRNLRKRMRKLSKRYDVEVKTQRDFSSVKDAMELFFNLHQKRWSSKGKPGAFASKTFRDFHLDVARIFDEKDWLALHFLIANDKPIAAIYSFNYNQKKYGYLTGFDPDFARYGVGNLLKMHAIEECIKKGFKEYDLTRYFEPYKAEWATGVRRNFVARMVRKGCFAKIYDHVLQSNFFQSITSKLGGHLIPEKVTP